MATTTWILAVPFGAANTGRASTVQYKITDKAGTVQQAFTNTGVSENADCAGTYQGVATLDTAWSYPIIVTWRDTGIAGLGALETIGTSVIDDVNITAIKVKTDQLTFGAGGVNASVAGTTGVSVNAYAGGPAVTVSNAAPTINVFVERGTDDPIPFVYATSAGTPISLAGQLLVIHVKASRGDSDTNAISHWASAAVSLGGVAYTNCITLADQTASPGHFTVAPPKAETDDTSKYPDRQSRFYSIKTFGTGQGFIARGTFTVGTETVNSIVSPT